MLVSIVSGTFNRLQALNRMVRSVRDQLHPGIDYEFVIVDAGSTDGTIEWCKAQSDIRLIEHGERRGAISAFCEGAYTAQGQYVVLANDDVIFFPHSIYAALSHLQTYPSCGAVAFADNRERTEYRVMGHKTRTAQGQQISTAYAQVGMFRKWLGDHVGWWGASDPVMGRARTYGGDNYISSRIWESGFTIDAVAGAKVQDNKIVDDLRKANYVNASKDSATYYERFPDGAVFGAAPVNRPSEQEGLRILYLPIHENATSRIHKAGLRNALKKMGTVLEYDYLLRESSKVDLVWELYEIAGAFKPDVLYIQVHTATPLYIQLLKTLRAILPNLVVINWNGDYWVEKYMHPLTLEFVQLCDVALVVNASIIPEYEARGIRAAYVQDASEEPSDLPDMPSYDVLFLGNNYQGTRQTLGKTLKALPYKVGLYGMNWGELSSGQTYNDHASTHALIRNAKIIIGDMQFPDALAYVSNRFWNTIHAGGFHLQQTIPGFEELTGIVAGKHYATWDTFEDLPAKVEYWMTHEKEREKIRKAGQKFIQTEHSYEARVRQVFTEIVPSLIKERV